MFYFQLICSISSLDHTLDKLVDFLSTISSLSTLEEMHKLRLVGESTTGTCELEWPQEVICLLEVRSDSVNFVNEVGTALYPDRSDALLDDRIVGDGDALLVELAKSALVNELLDGRSGGVAVGHIRLDEAKHTNSRLVKLDKGGVVDLPQAEKLHNLLGLGRNSNGTPDTNDQGELGHGGHEESTLCLGLTTVGNCRLLGGLVFGGVLLGGSDRILLVLALLLPGFVGRLLGLLCNFGLGGLLLQDGFGDLGRHGNILIGIGVVVVSCVWIRRGKGFKFYGGARGKIK